MPTLRLRCADALALLGLALLALLFFWPVTFNHGWIPRGGGDLVSFLWPTYSYAAQALRAGRVPLWNPTLYSGAPLLADNQSGVFYPPNLILFLLWPGLPYRALEWLVVFHVWLAGAGMYALMRVLLPHAARATALVAAVAFMFSDIFVTHVGNLNIVAVSAWLPWAVAALHLALTRASAGWAAAAGAVLAVAALAGHAQMTLVLALALALVGVWHAWRMVARLGGGRRRIAYRRLLKPAVLQLAGLLALAVAVAVGLSALSLLPAIEMAAHTGRARLDYASASAYSLPWAGLLGLFSPLVYGRGAAAFWAPWERVALGYAGAATLLLAALAPLRRGSRPPWLFVLLGCLGLLIALGRYAPLHRLLYAAVPGFAQLRVPARFILLTDFSLAALAGYGLHCALALPRRALWPALRVPLAALLAAAAAGGLLARWLVPGAAEHAASLWAGLALGGGLLAAAAALLVWVRPLAAPALVALVAADLMAHGAFVEVERSDPTAGYHHPQVVAYLREQPGPVRMDNAASTWAPDAAARYGLEDIGGIFNPLGLAAYQTYAGAVGARGTPLYNFLNAQFVLADKGQPPGDASFVPVFDLDPTLDVYLNTGAQPRVRLVYAAEVVASGEAAFGLIHAPGFDPMAQVVLEAPAEAAPPVAPPPGAEPGNLFYLDYAADAFTVQAETPAPAYLVFSEVWYPGWRAWVNGAEAPVLKANFAFRAVYLPAAGAHTVTMRFDPPAWKVGLTLTLLTLAALLLWAALAWRRGGARG